MDEDSAELLSDDEMRERMKAQNMEECGGSDPATETAPAPVVEAPLEEQPQAAAMSAEDKFWQRMDKSFERERAFMTRSRAWWKRSSRRRSRTRQAGGVGRPRRPADDPYHRQGEESGGPGARHHRRRAERVAAQPRHPWRLGRRHRQCGEAEPGREALLTLLPASMQAQHLMPWTPRRSGPSIVKLRWMSNVAAASAQFVLAQKLQ